MKYIATIAVMAALLCATAKADTNTAAVKSAVIGFVQDTSATKALILAVYPSYAPQLITAGKKDQFGFGVAVLHPLKEVGLEKYGFVGLRGDYLGSQFFAMNVNVGLKADVQLFGLNFTPIFYTGGVFALSGAGNQNGDLGYIVGGGLSATVWRGKLFGKDASFALAATAEKWSQFAGEVYHIAPVLKIAW